MVGGSVGRWKEVLAVVGGVLSVPWWQFAIASVTIIFCGVRFTAALGMVSVR
jgi:hypothetical protein